MKKVKIKTLNLNNLIEACFDVYQEIGFQIGEPRTILLRKIISHLECINVLLAEQFTHEILIILRSAFESMILFCYLTVHTDKQQEYISDSELMEFKNTFILVKNWKKDIELGNPWNLNWDEAIKYHEDIFYNRLSELNKKYILEKLEFNEYKVNQENFDKIDKFFKTDKRLRKPFFMDMEKMYSELPQMYQIGVGLRDLVFDDYNINSQVTHGQYQIWTRGMYTDDRFLENVKMQLMKIVTYPLLYLKKGEITINLKKLARLKNITDQLIANINKYQ
jgi:hypothetical protein